MEGRGLQWVITGASRGLGLEFVRALRERGDAVVATVRSRADAGALEDLGAEVHLLEVTDEAQRAAFAEALTGRPVDVLLNNAGVMGRQRELADVELEDLERCFRINAVAPLAVTRALLPNLEAGGRKLLLQMTSRMGSITDNGSGGAYAYRASKAALNALHKSLSLDLASRGFTCVALHPGWVQTDMGGGSAPLSVKDSVAGLLRVIDSLSVEDNGAFIDTYGDRLPW